MSSGALEPRSVSTQSLLAAIEGQIEPIPISPVYRLGLLLVTIGMIVLPLVYLSLIGAVAYATYHHAVHNHVVFAAARGRSARGAAVVYFGPIAIGTILVLFMIKPLFAGRGKQQPPVRLDRKTQPRLFAYVERLCQAVHSPVPREICVDCEVNASASFRHGLWSMIGNDLTLTIGLPLVAGMSLRQLSGILAHEFGHFAQGAGMRLTFVIRAISLWFVRVVYERDAWDEKLDDWARSLRGGLALVLHLARFCVWLVRRILWCLMVIGHGISGFMLRQMEFDADRHEARLAGSAAFQGTSERLVELSAAAQMAQQDLGQFFSEGRLADDFPRLVLANVEQITPEMRTEILKHSLEAETGLFDTHPATRDRIASANRENASGLYRQPTKSGDHPETHPCHSDRRAAVERDAPSEGHLTAEVTDIAATDLFDDFPAVARTATLQYYCQALDREIRPDELHPVESLLGRQSADLAAGKALHRYFQGCCSPLRSIHLGDEAHLPLAIDDTTRTSLGVARDKALSLVASYRLTFREFDNADTEWLKAVRAQAILESHAKVNLSKLQIAQSSANEANTLRQSLEATMSSHEEALGPFEQSSATRLTIALRLTQTESIAREVDPDRDQRERTARLVSSITLVNGLSGKVTQVRNSLVALAALLNCIEGNEEHQGLITAIKSRAMELRTHLIELRDSLGDAPYPFEHASPDMTLARFVLVPPERGPDHTPIEIPFSDDIGNLLTIAKQAGERMSSLHLRLLAHAALLAERVESLLGFEPLPEPPQDNPSNAPQAISAGTSSA